MKRAWVVMAVVGVVAGCQKVDVEKPTPSAISQPLQDMSLYAVGRGYDRGLDEVRNDCFQRNAPSVAPVNEWVTTGFTVYRDVEVASKIKSSAETGTKVEYVEASFGSATASRLGQSGERSMYVMLSKYTSHIESAGEWTGVKPTCESASRASNNGLEDFVSLCGDSFLQRKVYGGHVLISWSRDASSLFADDLFATHFGAATAGASFNMQTGLEALASAGYGGAEVIIETVGMPFPPPLVNVTATRQGFTVQSALDYIRSLSRMASPGLYQRAIDYTIAPHEISGVNDCLALASSATTVTQSEWKCMYGVMGELVEARDGIGDLSSMALEFERHRIAVDEYLPAGRLTFSSVLQSRCPGIDADGDPELETSGPCQEKALKHFVDFYRACQTSAGARLTECRTQHLGNEETCDGFKAVCGMPKGRLLDGTTVECTAVGLNAALADVISYSVIPPRNSPFPGAQFTDILKFQFMDEIGHIPGVGAATHACGITGLRGALHESTVQVFPGSGVWNIRIKSGNLGFFKQTLVDVSCVNLQNFVAVNGHASFAEVDSETFNVPALNAGLGSIQIYKSGIPYLLGIGNDLPKLTGYLSEPQTFVRVEPNTALLSELHTSDLFPFVSPFVNVGLQRVLANAPSSGGVVGGSAAFPMPPSFGVDYGSRSTAIASRRLPERAWCVLAGVSGAFYNLNDGIGVNYSDGRAIAQATTPLDKDRNPGGWMQCFYFDH